MPLLLRVKLQGNEWCIIIPMSRNSPLLSKIVSRTCRFTVRPIAVKEALSSGFVSEKLLIDDGRTAQKRFIYTPGRVIKTGCCVYISHVSPVQNLFW